MCFGCFGHFNVCTIGSQILPKEYRVVNVKKVTSFLLENPNAHVVVKKKNTTIAGCHPALAVVLKNMGQVTLEPNFAKLLSVIMVSVA